MKRISMMLCVIALSLGLLSACSNTIDGAGRDIERAGQNIQNSF